MKKNFIHLILAVLIFVLLTGLTAGAETDTAGNVFVNSDEEAAVEVERDLYWAGNNRSFTGYTIGKSLLAAGRDIAVNDSTIGGSLRAAGYTILVNDAEVADNITAAGYSLQFSDVKTAGAYLAGNTLTFTGEADSAVLLGNSVFLDGTVHGDVLIGGSSISFGPNLTVDGTLTVSSSAEPVLPETASVGNYVFNTTEKASEAEPAEEEPEVKEVKSSGGFGRFVRGLLGTLLLAALICLLLGQDEMEKPGNMLLSRPLPVILSGFASVFVIPGVILVLLLIGIGLPSAGLLALLYSLVCIYAVVFAGATLANSLMPKFTDSAVLNNFWLRSLIGALVFWLLRKIPFVGVIILAGSLVYSFGYFVQCIFLRLRGNKARGPKGALETGEAGPEPDVLEPVKKAEPESYVDPVLAEAEELFSPKEEEEPSDETPAEETADPEDVSGTEE